MELKKWGKGLSEEEGKVNLRKELIHAGLLLTSLSAHLVNVNISVKVAHEKAKGLLRYYTVSDAIELDSRLDAAAQNLDAAFNNLRQVMEKVMHMIDMVK